MAPRAPMPLLAELSRLESSTPSGGIRKFSKKSSMTAPLSWGQNVRASVLYRAAPCSSACGPESRGGPGLPQLFVGSGTHGSLS